MPYRQGYSVLPKLNKLKPDDPVFIKDKNFNHFLLEKWKAFNSQRTLVVDDSHSVSSELLKDLRDFIISRAPWVKASVFTDCSLQLQEDLAIHRMEGDEDWLQLADICFPSDWLPEDKVGKSFAEIHGPVPGMSLDRSKHIVKAMIYNGPFERFVWSPVYDDWNLFKINYHPSQPKALFNLFINPQVHLKVERQVIWGFPEHNAALFVMRQNLIPFEDLDLDKLYSACHNMTEDEKKYKGVTEDFIDWLYMLVHQDGTEPGWRSAK